MLCKSVRKLFFERHFSSTTFSFMLSSLVERPFRVNLFKQYQCFSVMNNFLQKTITQNSTCGYFYFCAPPMQGFCGRLSFFEKAEAIKTLINLWYSRGALDLEDCRNNKALMAAICLGYCGYGWPRCELGGDWC